MRPLFIIALLFQLQLFAQPATRDAERLAMHFLEQGEFEKANLYFEEVYPRNEEYWYPHYLKSLIGAKELAKAEKITKKLIRQVRYSTPYYVYLGQIYGLEGDKKKEQECYDKAIKEVSPTPDGVHQLGQLFVELKSFDYAINTYNKGYKLTNYPFFYEKAEVYRQKNDLVSMINEYLDALEYRETELQVVQMQLQNSLGYDDETGGMKNPLLRQELQKRIEKSPDKIVLSEFLIFLLIQQKDFDGAYVHCRALDKRLKEDGQRVYNLGKICQSNSRWESAAKCYEYLLSKGNSSVYYNAALVDLVNVEYLSITAKVNPPVAELKKVETRLQSTWKQYGHTELGLNVAKNLASLQAFYLGQPDTAAVILNEIINDPAVSLNRKAEFKLMLGDVYILTGALWDASLLYSQVEKAFKFETIGHEAKFRNAYMSYYAGEFKWAKTQADVLKGSVEKLIANDALELSLIISDAIGVDTNAAPLKMFAAAELLIKQGRFKEAMVKMDSINLVFNNHTLGDDIFYKKAEIYRKTGLFSDAEKMYKNILEYYPTGLYGDNAQMQLALLYENDLKDVTKASEAYSDMLTKYPGSVFTVEARKRYRLLRGDNIN